jgi:hypothetical protein
MGDGQIGDELSSQVFHFRRTQRDIPVQECLTDLRNGPMVLEQRPSDKYQDIPGHIAPGWDQTAQIFRLKGAPAFGTLQQRFMRDKRRRHAHYCLLTGLLHLQPVAAPAGISRRTEPDNRYARKQTGRPGLPGKPLKTALQCL